MVEVPIQLFKYWWDIVHDEFLDNPNSGLNNLEASMSDFYSKWLKKKGDKE